MRTTSGDFVTCAGVLPAWMAQEGAARFRTETSWGAMEWLSNSWAVVGAVVLAARCAHGREVVVQVFLGFPHYLLRQDQPPAT
jgi:hypothetical protein